MPKGFNNRKRTKGRKKMQGKYLQSLASKNYAEFKRQTKRL